MLTYETEPTNEKPTFTQRAVPALIAGSLFVGALLWTGVVLYIVKGPATIELVGPFALGALLGAIAIVIVSPILGWAVGRFLGWVQL